MSTAGQVDPMFRQRMRDLIDKREDFRRISGLIDEQLNAGVNRQELIEVVTEIMRAYRAEGKEEEEEYANQALDVLTGW